MEPSVKLITVAPDRNITFFPALIEGHKGRAVSSQLDGGEPFDSIHEALFYLSKAGACYDLCPAALAFHPQCLLTFETPYGEQVKIVPPMFLGNCIPEAPTKYGNGVIGAGQLSDLGSGESYWFALFPNAIIDRPLGVYPAPKDGMDNEHFLRRILEIRNVCPSRVFIFVQTLRSLEAYTIGKADPPRSPDPRGTVRLLRWPHLRGIVWQKPAHEDDLRGEDAMIEEDS